MLRFLTAGESHGPGLVAIVEGLPAGLRIDEEAINRDLQRRQGGYGRGGRMQIEHDRVEVLSGVWQGRTIGAPVALRIENRDWAHWRDRDLPPLTVPRPGHADYAGMVKYGFDDARPISERASARETAARVAVGALARLLLAEFAIAVGGFVVEIGGVVAQLPDLPPAELWTLAEASDVRCPDEAAAGRMRAAIDAARAAGDSLGGVFVVMATGVPIGLGSHVHWERRLDARLAFAIMSIPAIKGVEIGPAFENARLPGTQVHDEFLPQTTQHGSRITDHGSRFTFHVSRSTNRAGGIEGGISNGQPIVVRAAMKPIPTTVTPLRSVDLRTGEPAMTQYQRSDVCAVPAAAVVGEAMVAWVLADALLEKLGGDHLSEMKERLQVARPQGSKSQGIPDHGSRITDHASRRVLSLSKGTTDHANLILTGFMGTGKTVVGREVARRLGREFVDMDEVIARQAGKSIPEIFAAEGEAAFRQMEAECCRELSQQRSLVIATGGGALIPETNRRGMEASGLVICLSCGAEETVRRLTKVNDRPLLEVADQRAEIERLLEHRREAYAAIPVQLDTTALTPNQVADRVIGLWQAWLEKRGTCAQHRLFTARHVHPAPPVHGDPALPVHGAAPDGGYTIHLGHGLLACLGERLREAGLCGAVAVVSNPTVWERYGQEVETALQAADLASFVCLIPEGEQHKTLDTVAALYGRFVEGRLDRGGTVIALGGGVVGDMAGFAAATYLRGVSLVQVPTTLLAMVDASVGGKTGVDLPKGKNLVGAFKQPALVVIDPEALRTLSVVELRCGLAEIVKAGIIGDAELFEYLEQISAHAGQDGILPYAAWNWPWIIRRALQVKISVVEEDPLERGRRAVLNLGHTFGHALEQLSGYTLRHGEAVGIGLIAAARLAVALGRGDPVLPGRLGALLKRLGLPTSLPPDVDPAATWEAMQSDKKRRNLRLRFVLPRRIGDVFVTDEVTQADVVSALEALSEQVTVTSTSDRHL